MTPQNQTPIQVTAKYTLSQEEKDLVQQNMLSARETKKNLEEEKKNVSNNYKTQIAEQELAIDKACNLLRDGFEFRPFQCYLVKNFDSSRREYYDTLTQDLIKTEPLNAGDFQTQMELEEKTIRENNEKEQSWVDEQMQEQTEKFKQLGVDGGMAGSPSDTEISPADELIAETDTIAQLNGNSAPDAPILTETKEETKEQPTQNQTIDNSSEVEIVDPSLLISKEGLVHPKEEMSFEELLGMTDDEYEKNIPDENKSDDFNWEI